MGMYPEWYGIEGACRDFVTIVVNSKQIDRSPVDCDFDIMFSSYVNSWGDRLHRLYVWSDGIGYLLDFTNHKESILAYERIHRSFTKSAIVENKHLIEDAIKCLSL